MKTFVCRLAISLPFVAFMVPVKAQPPSTDAARPPAFIPDSSKRLSEEDIRNKKKGVYVTGLPEIEINPINGWGVGANFYVYNNKTEKDPFFAYTPYRQRFTGFFKAFQSGKFQGALNVDIPYVFNTPWRVRFDIVHEEDPNFQYYGFGAVTMRPLSFIDKLSPMGSSRTFNRFDPYFENLTYVRSGNIAAGEAPLVTDRHFNELTYREDLYNVAGERIFFGGRVRLIFGYELLLVRIKDYFNRNAEEARTLDGKTIDNIPNGRTRLTQDYNGDVEGNPWRTHNISGYTGGQEGILAGALIYDTRDFEPDPSSGIFAEYSHEHSRPYLLSKFSFDKNMYNFAYYKKILPKYLSKTVFALNLSLGTIWGSNVPFYEAMDLSSQSEAGGTEVLGGARSLRGFREYRFVGPITALANVEIRARLAQTRFWRQHFAFSVIPFYDVGRVWDRIAAIGLHDYRRSYGAGVRIAWNQATIIRLDYGHSKEATQFFFGFGHIF